ncbi:hypothetical protein ZEAMMB73_Zm00001d024250 [Zea mays]|nr:hypothetical protein ZEAMMB73_Zm00001d024250 [Zea mays]
MEVAPSKLPSTMARCARLPRNLDTIAEDDDDKEAAAMESTRELPLRNASRGAQVVVVDAPVHCADKLACYLAPMAKTTECLKIKA